MNRTIRNIFLTTFCALVLAAHFTLPAYGLDLRPKIEPFANQLIQEDLAVGFVIGIVKDGETQVLAYGEKTRGAGNPPDGDTMYEIGSISKVFTGILLARLNLQGLVKLDDPIQDYVPAGVTVQVRDNQPITLKHLATHTSGLPRLPDNLQPKDMANPYSDYTVEQMYDFLDNYLPIRPPGQYEYSNYGMGLLGHLLAQRVGLTYEQFLARDILHPLGMKDTFITLDSEARKRLATPYDMALKQVENWDIPTLAGAGGIRSTCWDMLKFIRANISETGDLLHKALRLAQGKQHTMANGLGLALGWHIALDGTTLNHNGQTGGYHGWLAVAPNRKVGVVVLANTASMRISTFGETVTRIALGIDVAPPETHKVVAIDPAVLQSYIGVYQLTPEFNLTVTVEDGKLMVQATGQDRFQIFPESDTKFFYKVVDARITFIRDKDGRTKELILHQGGRDMKAARKN